MTTIDPASVAPAVLQQYLQHAIVPRPICLAATIDKQGNVNLSPFSFFNMFSTNPPVCIFSPARRVRDNTIKHTLENLYEVPECVINIVNYNMVQQTSLSSVEYAKGVNEFNKAGFTQIPSELIRPPRVMESPVQLECTVTRIIELAENPGAGNLVLAEVKLIHIQPEVLNENGQIDQHKLDAVARMGGDWYCRAGGNNLFKVAKPNTHIGIGIDALPDIIKHSQWLTGNHLGQLGNVTNLPDEVSVNEFRQHHSRVSQLPVQEKHIQAATLLNNGDVATALLVLLS